MTPLSPLDAAIDIAGPMADVSARNRVLEEVAKARFRLGRLEDALNGLKNAPNEKAVLRQLAIDAVNKNDADSTATILRRLVALDAESAPLAGRLAASLLDRGKPEEALSVIRSVEQPFENDRTRYDFVAKLLEHDRFGDARKLTETFKDTAFCDWARLAWAKRLATLGRRTEVEKVIAEFSSLEKRAWAYLEAARCSPTLREFLRQAGTILETLEVDKTNAEAVAIQRRIIGKALWNVGEQESARQLLESSEAALSIIGDPFRRLRAHCFLAGVIRKIGVLDSVRNYLDIATLRTTAFTPTQRSELLQWLAEASGNADDWTLAVREAATEEDETLRSRRIVDILRRFSYTIDKPTPTGAPDLDAVLLSGEEFEERYYSPFTVDSCDC